jgi:hypothetical protein
MSGAASSNQRPLACEAFDSVETMVSVYAHALERSHEAIREIVGCPRCGLGPVRSRKR